MRKHKDSKAYKIINAIFSSIIIAIFVVVFAVMIYLLTQLFSGKPPSIFGHRFYFVLTDSMAPTLNSKDMILSKVLKDNTDADYIKSMVHEGDIVTYIGKINQRDEFITHRVIRDENREDVIFYNEEQGLWMVITKGDNNPSADAPIPITKLSAVMVRKVTVISAIYNFVSNKSGGFILIGIPIILILIPFIIRLVIAVKTPTDKEDEKKRLEEDIARKAVADYIAEKNKAEEKPDTDGLKKED